MDLTSLMSHAGLAGYAEVALILFFAVFLGIVAWVFAPSRKKELSDASHLPLEDDGAPNPRQGVK